ncbi:MAG: hypothetical protein KDK53_07565 [Maritimibacter sp.]|nr:hypothetical protein [Maritimibacter sp.]
MSAQIQPGEGTGTERELVGLDAVLIELSKESSRLAEQCGSIQWSISAMLDLVDHPDLGAEIHMLQDVDRIQQTLADIADILMVAGGHTRGAPVRKAEIGAAIRLESLRQRLGLSEALAEDPRAEAASDVTWL